MREERSLFHEIASKLPRLSVLELGVGKGVNHSALTNKKFSVDCFGGCKPSFLGSTSDFFKQNKQRFDLVYIDANHDHENVIEDFNNSVLVSDFIFIHDTVPPEESFCDGNKCSDSYKVLYHFIKNHYDFVVSGDNYGPCFVWNPRPIKGFNNSNLSYAEFLDTLRTVDVLGGDDFIKFCVSKISGSVTEINE